VGNMANPSRDTISELLINVGKAECERLAEAEISSGPWPVALVKKREELEIASLTEGKFVRPSA